MYSYHDYFMYFLCWSLSLLSCWDRFCLLYIKQLSSKDTRISNILMILVVWWATSTTNMYPMFTNVLSFWISLVPSISHRPAGTCCTRPPNTSLRNSILLWYGWMIDPKTSYEIGSVGHPIDFSNIYPFQPEVLSLSFTHWVLFLGIYSIEMIKPTVTSFKL